MSKLARPFIAVWLSIGNGVVKLWRFLKDVYAELQRVVWPSHEETYSFTVVVMIAIGIVAAWVGLLDLVLARTMMALGIGK